MTINRSACGNYSYVCAPRPLRRAKPPGLGPYCFMEVVSGVASATQLLAYSHSTFQVLIKLYKQVRNGPASLKHQQSSVLVLLSVVDGLQRRPAPNHILTTLLELSKLATEALNLLEKVQKKGFLGLSWSSVRHEQLLQEVFASLKDKREVLHLAISVESMSIRNSTESSLSDNESVASTIHSNMKLRDWKFWRSIKHTDSGTNNCNIIGNGNMPERGVTRIHTNISGNGGFNYIGNVQDFAIAEHHLKPDDQRRSHAAGQSPPRPHHNSETRESTPVFFSSDDVGVTLDSRTETYRGTLPPVPQRHPGRSIAIEFREQPGPLITEESNQWTIQASSSNPSSPSEVDSPWSLGSPMSARHTLSPDRRLLRE